MLDLLRFLATVLNAAKAADVLDESCDMESLWCFSHISIGFLTSSDTVFSYEDYDEPYDGAFWLTNYNDSVGGGTINGACFAFRIDL